MKSDELNEQNKRLQQEIDDTKTAAALSEATKEDYVLEIRRQCDEEIKSLQIIMKGKYCSSSGILQFDDTLALLKHLGTVACIIWQSCHQSVPHIHNSGTNYKRCHNQMADVSFISQSCIYLDRVIMGLHIHEDVILQITSKLHGL